MVQLPLRLASVIAIKKEESQFHAITNCLHALVDVEMWTTMIKMSLLDGVSTTIPSHNTNLQKS